MNRMTVTKDGRRLGSVTTLRDRTELARLEREIGSFRSTSELLRAQAHEFANQLHTISGLIQIGEQDEVVRYVRALSRHRHSLDVTLSRRVHDTAVAALLMAKTALAAERRVDPADLRRHRTRPARPRGRPPTSRRWSATSSTTPIDAAAARPGGPSAGGAGARGLGRGGTAAGRLAAWRSSSATPVPAWPPNSPTRSSPTASPPRPRREGERGIGLALTRLVCERRGGEISVTNTPDGAMFTARMTVSRLADAVAEGATP